MNAVAEAYFFDTYAIIEILKANPLYAKYSNVKAIITILNLIELHYKLLRDFNEKLADELMSEYSKYLVDIDNNIIKEANEFKLINKGKKLSMPDAVGYATALRYGVKFLTGDRAFKDLKNVEFVK